MFLIVFIKERKSLSDHTLFSSHGPSSLSRLSIDVECNYLQFIITIH